MESEIELLAVKTGGHSEYELSQQLYWLQAAEAANASSSVQAALAEDH